MALERTGSGKSQHGFYPDFIPSLRYKHVPELWCLNSRLYMLKIRTYLLSSLYWLLPICVLCCVKDI
jgi:hypothetical protein